MAVLLSPVGGVAAQFFTNAGVPLSGGKIYTYAAGTSTPQATYTTGAGSIQHSNPIVLDAAGRVPTGEIWLTDGLSYKFVLKDANDVLIATYDNIVGINSNFVNFVNQQEIQTATAGQTVFTLTTMEYQPGTGNLSVFVDGVNQYGPGAQYAYTETSSTVVTFVSGLHVGASVKFTTTQIQNSGIGDASQITYTYPAVDAVEQSVEERLAQYVSVKDFGAVGDGVTDDTTAIQNALDSGAAQIYVNEGIYLISTTLQISSNTKFIGENYSTIKAKDNFGNIPLIINKTDNPQTDNARDKNISIKYIKFDGNKANNSSATEFSHGVQFNAVNGATLDVWTVDCKGDGVYLGYSRDQQQVGTTQYDIGCSNINGYIRSDTCARQGVAITCGDNFNLNVIAYKADLLGFDIEPDSELSHVRNGVIYINAEECGQAVSGTRGGILINGTNVTGTNRADVSNIEVIINALNCTGDGVIWRDVVGVSFTGSISGQTGNGVVGLDGNTASSYVKLNVNVNYPSNTGITARGANDIIDGNVVIVNPDGSGANIQNAAGGTLCLTVKNSGEQGLLLYNTNNMVFPNAVISCNNYSGVYVYGSSTGNRFPNLKSISSGPTFGYGLEEANTANNNRATNTILSGPQGTAQLVGATSFVTLEPLVGKATYNAPSIASGGSTSSTITVTGAAVGNEVNVSFGVSLAGLILTSYVSSTNTVTFVLYNPTGSPIDLASTTVKAIVTPFVSV